MRYYLGRPDTFGMLAAPPAGRGTTTKLSRDEASVPLGSGGTAVTRSAQTKRDSVSWTFDPVGGRGTTPQAQWAGLRDLYRGLYGPGPYRLVDPNDVNLMPVDDTLMRSVGRWTATAGALAVVADTDPRFEALTWAAGAAASLLHCGPLASSGTGLDAGVPDPATAVPYLADRPLIFSCTVSVLAGASPLLALRAGRRLAAGTFPVQVFGPDTPSSGTARRLNLWVPPGSLGSRAVGYVTLGLVSRGGDAGTVLRVSQPQIQYALGSEVLADPWEPGVGCPTVSLTLGGAKMALSRQRSWSLQAVEL